MIWTTWWLKNRGRKYLTGTSLRRNRLSFNVLWHLQHTKLLSPIIIYLIHNLCPEGWSLITSLHSHQCWSHFSVVSGNTGRFSLLKSNSALWIFHRITGAIKVLDILLSGRNADRANKRYHSNYHAALFRSIYDLGPICIREKEKIVNFRLSILYEKLAVSSVLDFFFINTWCVSRIHWEKRLANIMFWVIKPSIQRCVHCVC